MHQVLLRLWTMYEFQTGFLLENYGAIGRYETPSLHTVIVKWEARLVTAVWEGFRKWSKWCSQLTLPTSKYAAIKQKFAKSLPRTLSSNCSRSSAVLFKTCNRDFYQDYHHQWPVGTPWRVILIQPTLNGENDSIGLHAYRSTGGTRSTVW